VIEDGARSSSAQVDASFVSETVNARVSEFGFGPRVDNGREGQDNSYLK
jgi:hypothetical protein